MHPLEDKQMSHSESEALNIVDVRTVPPPQKHPMIFSAFKALPVGGAFVLVNDHDPKPLYYQFQFELIGEFSWDYLERGPEVWRVRIGRVAAGKP